MVYPQKNKKNQIKLHKYTIILLVALQGIQSDYAEHSLVRLRVKAFGQLKREAISIICSASVKVVLSSCVV